MAAPIRVYRMPGSPPASAGLPKIPIGGFTDTFTRADNPTTLGNTEDGKPWTILNGTWGINQGAAYLAAVGAGGFQMAVAEAFTRNGTYTVDIPTVGTTAASILLRVQDANNYLFVNGGGTNGLRLWKRVNGSASAIAEANAAGTVLTAGTYTVVLSGTTFAVKKNGTTVLTATGVTDFSTMTRHGIAVSGADTATRFGAATFTP